MASEEVPHSTEQQPDSSGDRDRRDRDRDRRDRDRDRRDRDRDRRDRDRDRRGGDKDRDRDRDRDRRKRKRSGSRDKERDDRDRDRRSKRGDSRDRPRDEFDPPDRDDERDKNRDDYTIFVHQIHPKVDDRDLFDFFSHVGRVLDIRLIRDQRTFKSKGLAYIEFWQKDSVPKAIALNGCELGGYAISIAQAQSDTAENSNLPDIPMRLYVGSLHPNVGEEDLRQVFEAFGELMSVQMGKDEKGESKGFAYVTYKKETEAKQALGALDGLEIAGRAIKVGVVDVAQTGSYMDAAGELDDSGGGLNMTAAGRQALMAKLGRGTMPGMPAPTPSYPQASNSGIMQAQNLAVPMIQATTCLVIKNMFDPATETDAEFHLDIQEDMEEECEKIGIRMAHIHVDKKHSGGHVFLRLNSVDMAKKVATTFHGRWFASRQITAEFVPETTYLQRFPKT